MESLAKSGFNLDPEKKGTFTRYCKNKGFSGPTMECVEEGLASKNVTTRRRAQFAKNAKAGFKNKRRRISIMACKKKKPGKK